MCAAAPENRQTTHNELCHVLGKLFVWQFEFSGKSKKELLVFERSAQKFIVVCATHKTCYKTCWASSFNSFGTIYSEAVPFFSLFQSFLTTCWSDYIMNNFYFVYASFAQWLHQLDKGKKDIRVQNVSKNRVLRSEDNPIQEI